MQAGKTENRRESASAGSLLPCTKQNYLSAITLPNSMPEEKHQIRYSA